MGKGRSLGGNGDRWGIACDFFLVTYIFVSSRKDDPISPESKLEKKNYFLKV